MQTPRHDPAPLTESVDALDQLPPALFRLGLGRPRPVLVSVGGACGLEAPIAARLALLFRDRLIPLLERIGAMVIDGGTDAGVMALMGQARQAAGARFPLLGIAARDTVRLFDEPADAGAALEPHHSHRLLVPGRSWGDEIAWMNAVAGLLSADHGSATLVSAGGRITAQDVDASLRCRRVTLLLAGSGGTADAIATGRRHPLLWVVPEDGDWRGLVAALKQALAAGAGSRWSRAGDAIGVEWSCG